MHFSYDFWSKKSNEMALGSLRLPESDQIDDVWPTRYSYWPPETPADQLEAPIDPKEAPRDSFEALFDS